MRDPTLGLPYNPPRDRMGAELERFEAWLEEHRAEWERLASAERGYIQSLAEELGLADLLR